MFCPYGVIYPWPERKIALKCDRCTYMENPVCVEVCPCKALELVEIGNYEEMLCKRRQEVTQKLAKSKKPGLLLLDLD
jgi:carbon-monoxide dehydrogenase iron sulfur subunit